MPGRRGSRYPALSEINPGHGLSILKLLISRRPNGDYMQGGRRFRQMFSSSRAMVSNSWSVGMPLRERPVNRSLDKLFGCSVVMR